MTTDYEVIRSTAARKICNTLVKLGYPITSLSELSIECNNVGKYSDHSTLNKLQNKLEKVTPNFVSVHKHKSGLLITLK